MLFTPLISEHNLSSLRTAMRDAQRKIGRSEALGEPAFKRLSAPVRLLGQLHEMSEGVYQQDRQAITMLRSALVGLIDRFPQYKGSVDRLRERVRREPAPGGGGIQCGFLNPGGLFPTYLAVASVFAGRPEELAEALDVVAGLSLEHGHLEVLHGAMVHQGLEGLVREITWAESMNIIETDLVGYTPIPDGPVGPGLPPLPFPPNPWPPKPMPKPDPCELLREGCEAMLMDALQSDIGTPPTRPDKIAWADNITSIEMSGECAGDTMIIHGNGFGDSKPNGVKIVMNVDGKCTAVQTDSWTNDQIELTLPEGVRSGSVGFVDVGYLKAYNGWADRFNQVWFQMQEASRCFGFGSGSSKPLMPYIPFPCPPDLGINMIKAGKPIIHVFTVNFAEELAVGPEDQLILRWAVENADDVTIFRVSNQGPDFGGNTSIQNPSGSSWDLGPAGHSTPQVFRYRLLAENGCGSEEKFVVINATKRPALSIESIEVTQGIQNLTNILPLVREKSTVVRVRVRHGLQGFSGDQVPNVKGRLRTRQTEESWESWLDPINGSTANPPEPTPGAAITVQANPDREQTNDTLNFILPTGRCRGEIDIEVDVRVDGFGATAGIPGFDERINRVFESQEWVFPITMNHFGFYRRRRLHFRYIRVEWGGVTPTPEECEKTIRQGIYRIPANITSVEELEGVGVQHPPNGYDLTDNELNALPAWLNKYLREGAMNNLLDEFDDRHNCSLWESLTSWLGSDCPEDDITYWVLMCKPFYRGRAAGTPSNTCATYAGDWTKMAHELSHCLDQKHIERCGAEGGEDPDDFPDRGTLDNVPFDIENNRTVRSGTLTVNGVTFPDPVKDIMTYCNIRWPHPTRWLRLYGYIGS